MSKNKKPTSEVKVVVLPNARKLTNDEICRCVFGKPLEAIIKDIRDNKDGKYDSLYKPQNLS